MKDNIVSNIQLSSNLKKIIEKEFNKDEVLLWAGKPILGSKLYIFILIITLGVCWIILIALFNFRNISNLSFDFLAIIRLIILLSTGIVFILIGIFNINQIQKTQYLLSNQRALIIDYSSDMDVQSFYPDKLQNIKIIKNNRSGSIIFEVTEYRVR